MLEREVRANLVYRDFTRVGAGKAPDAKTMGRWGLALGPEGVEKIHERVVEIAVENQVVKGHKMRLHFSRRASPAASATLRAASHQGFIHARHQLFVLQYLVGVLHPVFPQVAHLFGDEAFAKMELLPARVNHARCSW